MNTLETPFRKEVRLFSSGFKRLGNSVFNKFFNLSPQAAAARSVWLTISFFLFSFMLTLFNYPLGLWFQRLQDIFYYAFNATYRASHPGNPLENLILFAIQVAVDPRNVRILPLLFAPFFIALQSAAIYLADIFEIEDVSIARKHVGEIALSGSDQSIRISHGDIAEEHRNSPNYLIGGPGKVIVDLDSVALFEKPDGTPHVIGPTSREPGGKAKLEGFERFREAIDLRDQFIDLRDQDLKSASVKGRSQDGIPVTATDVRLMFSVYRVEDPEVKDPKKEKANEKPAEKDPYPFSKKAIENIIYKSVSSVTPDLPNPSTYKFSWINNMISLVRGELGGFMTQRQLTAYLASIGHPERDKAIKREEEIVDQARRVIPPSETPPEPQDVPPVPEFTPRHRITNLFTEFANKFTENARERGVVLHWIGVGMWKTPISNVFDKHFAAWKQSRENQVNSSEEAMAEYENESRLKKLLTIIKEVPVLSYRRIVGSQKQSFDMPKSAKANGSDDVIFDKESLEILKAKGYTFVTTEQPKPTSHQEAMRLLLLEYRKLLIEAAEFIQAKDEHVPTNILSGLKQVEVALGIVHWIGKGARTATESVPDMDSAETEFQKLVRLANGDASAAERLIASEQSKFPNEDRSSWIKRATAHLIRDRH